MGIKKKFLAISLLLALLPLAIAGVYAYYYSSGALEDTTIRHLEYELHSKAGEIEQFMKGIHKDVLFLAGSPNFQELTSYPGLKNSPEYMRLRKKAEKELFSLSKSRPHYYQLRYINEQGYEVARVDSDGAVPQIYPEDKLQYKGDRYYFRESMKYSKGQCYVSKMDMNVELSEVEIPHKPVVRIATPIYDGAGKGRGIVIINLYANYLLRQLKTFSVAKGGITFMVNKEGFYISHFDSDKRIDTAYSIGTTEKLGKDYTSNIAGKILSGGSGTVHVDHSVISYAPIHTGDEVANNYWVLAIVYPKKYILGAVWTLKMVFVMLGMISIIVASVVGLWMARRYTEPILKLHKGVEWIAGGDFDHTLRISTGDEIEDLAGRFNEMTGKLKASKEKMEKWNSRLAQEVEVRSGELVKERNKFESVIMGAAEGIIVADENGLIVIVNPKAELMLNAHKADLIGKNLYSYYQCIEKTPSHAKGDVKDVPPPGTIVLNSRLIETSWTHIGNRGERAGSMMVMRDISERQRFVEERLTMERQLLLADKLVSIGELASGIAHEIGNPLAGIKTVVQAMNEEGVFSGAEKKYVKRILNEVNRLAAFLKTFNEYTNPWISESPKGKIEPVLRDISFFVGKEAARRNIDIYYNVEKNMPEIMMDATHIKQIITNLVLNAMQAMQNGGKISVRAAAVPRGDHNVTISVSDNGPGIPEEIVSKIFDPFFTTKPKGTGLGLSIVQKIVKEHQGTIQVVSQLGEGTTFEITIPMVKQNKPPNRAREN